MLRLNDISAFYGLAQATYNLDLDVPLRSVTALLGRNGAGKTTTLKACVGLVEHKGRVRLFEKDLGHLRPHEIARRGIAYVPEERGIFSRLTVEENLSIAFRKGGIWTPQDVFARFPRLHDRKASLGNALSGGEQQMLAIARSLVSPVDFLLLDEPTEGLAPAIVEVVADVIREVAELGVGVLLVEQRLDVCVDLAEYFYVLDSGRLTFQGNKEEFVAADHVRDEYLSV